MTQVEVKRARRERLTAWENPSHPARARPDIPVEGTPPATGTEEPAA